MVSEREDGYGYHRSNENFMRVEVVNTTKKLTCIISTGVPYIDAVDIANNLGDAEVREHSHYSEGDTVYVQVVGGRPPVTMYRRGYRDNR